MKEEITVPDLYCFKLKREHKKRVRVARTQKAARLFLIGILSSGLVIFGAFIHACAGSGS